MTTNIEATEAKEKLQDLETTRRSYTTRRLKTLFQVPGRLALLITLYLIASNTYSSVKGPNRRGFSYVELWMVGVQTSLLVAIFEYGVILALKKYPKMRKVDKILQLVGTDTSFRNDALSR